MKKILCALLALMFLLSGCAGSGQPDQTTAPAQIMELPEVEFDTPVQENPGQPLNPIGGSLEGDQLAFANPAVSRVAYTGIRSYVKYITSPQELPNEGQWQGFDDAFFEKHALLVVVETVNSGSVRLELESITVADGVASVSIKRSLSGEVGTSDMATWMLWAQVEKGLDYTWTLANATELPQGEQY